MYLLLAAQLATAAPSIPVTGVGVEPAAPSPALAPVWAEIRLIFDTSRARDAMSWTGTATLTLDAWRTLSEIEVGVPERVLGASELQEITIGGVTFPVSGSRVVVPLDPPLQVGERLDLRVRWIGSGSKVELDGAYLPAGPEVSGATGDRWPHQVVVDIPVDSELSAASSGGRVREQVVGSVRRLVARTADGVRELPVITLGAWEPNAVGLGQGALARVRVGSRLDMASLGSLAMAQFGALTRRLGAPSCTELELVEQQKMDHLHWTALGCVITVGRLQIDEDNAALLRAIYTSPDAWFLAHELAHLWFPFTVGMRSREEDPFSEALAEYLAGRVLEDLGEEGASRRRYVGAERDIVGRTRLFSAGPFDNHERQGEGIAYSRWVLAMRALEARVGREVLDGALADVVVGFREQGMRIADLEAAVSARAGLDLSAFFGTWRAAAIPEVTVRREGDVTTLVTGMPGRWELPVSVGGTIAWVVVADGVGSLPTGAVRVDPERWLAYQRTSR